MLPNINLNDTELEDIITQWLADLTGLDPDKGEIRIAYGQDNYPSWTHEDTVIAYYLNPVSDTYGEDIGSNYREIAGILLNKEDVFTQVYDCIISVYGPECRSLATRIRTSYLLDEKRLLLSKNGIYPVKGTPPCTFVPYEFNSQWWKRSDLTIRMNIYTTLTSQVDRIDSVGIKVITHEIGEKDVDIVTQTGG